MIGKFFCLAILVFSDIPVDLEQNYSIPSITRNQALNELMQSNELLGKQEQVVKEPDIMSSGSGSDSDPTQDNLEETELEKLIPAACI